jgi:hypothetical protein
VPERFDLPDVVEEAQPDQLRMEGNIAFRLRILDAALFVLRNVDVRPATFAIQDDVVQHRIAKFLAAPSRIEDEDRNEIQRTMKDLLE